MTPGCRVIFICLARNPRPRCLRFEEFSARCARDSRAHRSAVASDQRTPRVLCPCSTVNSIEGVCDAPSTLPRRAAPARAAPLLATTLRATRVCGQDQKALPRRGASASAARALSAMTRVDSCRNATKRATVGRPAGAVRAQGVARRGARARYAPGRLARCAGAHAGMSSVAAVALTHRTESGRDAVHPGGAPLAPGADDNCSAVARSGARRRRLAHTDWPLPR